MGFTLIELMVVIMIIALLSGLILSAVGGNSDSQNINAGITRLRSMMSLAQSAAISRKQTMRVLINFDSTDPDKLLRFATIVYRQDDGGTPNDEDDDTWMPYTDGEYLPDGVFFSPALSSDSDDTAPLILWTVRIDLALDPDDMITPVVEPDDQTNYRLNGLNNDPLSHGPGANRWYIYEFAPNGTYSPPIGQPGTRCVVVDGVNPTGNLLIIPNEEREDVFRRAQGFKIFRSGKPMFFQEPEQIADGNS